MKTAYSRRRLMAALGVLCVAALLATGAAYQLAWPGAAAKGDWVQLQLSRGEPVARLLAMAAKSGVQDLQTRQESLEDMFLRMYGGRNE